MSTVTKICSVDGCDSPFLARGWCSKHYTRWIKNSDPSERVRREVRGDERRCSKCMTFVPLTGFYSDKQSWCANCAAAHKRQTYVPITIPLPSVYCVECGTRYSPTRRTDITCSPKCAEQRKTRFNRQGEMQRRALLKASYVEDVDRSIVFERDAWICQLCHENIDSSLVWPASGSASVDHIRPLNRGGDHSYKNCQAAHLGCNAGKSDRYIG